MTTKTRLEDLGQLSAHAQRLVEQSRLLAQGADHVASQWPSEQSARPGRGVPAADLETLNTELTRQLTVERARGEAERARLEAILGMTHDAVLVMDATGLPVLTNRAYAELFGPVGFVLEDERGDPLPERETPQGRAARGEPFSLSFVVRRVDGSHRWCEANGQPLRHEGETYGVVVIRDITERMLRRRQDEFLALASHELRTPLTPLAGYLQLIQREGDLDRSRRFAELAHHQTQRLNRLVGDLLDVGRFHGGKLHLVVEPLDVGALVARVCASVEINSPAPIRLDMPTMPVMVSGDAVRLEQVLLNLLTNALTYAPQSPFIDVRLAQTAEEAVLDVEDYGPGIPAPALPHLFSRFYQVEQRERPSQQGLGLGLFICHQLVTAHEGSITVRSGEGEGSVFTVRLPLVTDAARTACDANGTGPVPGGSGDTRCTPTFRVCTSPGAIARHG
ncbi:MAG TPA: PAS domain-containing sensor histidine kinase, partial [Chloroflexota bacterium]|nr:PAS domain-containing sensor histidine kinase [Chloroflexota bacterium]